MLLIAEKQLDLTFGDVPVVFCQVCNLLALKSCYNGNVSILLGSIIVAFIMIGYNQSTLFYYGDTDPVNRRKVPSFYGLVPDDVGKRLATLSWLVLFIAGFSATKILACSFLFYKDPMILCYWLLGDLCVYLILLRSGTGMLKTWHASSDILSTVVTRLCEVRLERSDSKSNILNNYITNILSLVRFSVHNVPGRSNADLQEPLQHRRSSVDVLDGVLMDAELCHDRGSVQDIGG